MKIKPSYYFLIRVEFLAVRIAHSHCLVLLCQPNFLHYHLPTRQHCHMCSWECCELSLNWLRFLWYNRFHNRHFHFIATLYKQKKIESTDSITSEIFRVVITGLHYMQTNFCKQTVLLIIPIE